MTKSFPADCVPVSTTPLALEDRMEIPFIAKLLSFFTDINSIFYTLSGDFLLILIFLCYLYREGLVDSKKEFECW